MTTAIIGGGAAGFFAALTHALHYPGRRVVILEKSGRFLEKVRISGGGRCNVTHNCVHLSQLLKAYPRGEKFLRHVLPRFMPADTIAWFAKRGVALKTEADGRVFPKTDNSQTIVDVFLRESQQLGIELRVLSPVRAIRIGRKFSLDLGEKGTLEAERVIIATGGSPRESGLDWLKNLGFKVVPPVPSLFTFNLPHSAITSLAGVSVKATTVKIGKTIEQGPILITHWGLSGPAILRASAWGAREIAQMDYRFAVRVNWHPQRTVSQIEQRFLTQQLSRRQISTAPIELPERLWEYFLVELGIDHTRKWAELSARDRNRLLNKLTNDVYEVRGKTTHKEEFVTCGGIALEDIDPATMQAKHLPGLYLAGEVLDIDGITGGFNFQAAWAMGFVAGISAD